MPNENFVDWLLEEHSSIPVQEPIEVTKYKPMVLVEPTSDVVIAGGRDFNDYDFLKRKCDLILANLARRSHINIISGGARGADALAIRYAEEKEFQLTVMKANWERYGKSAGFIRNTYMAKSATHLIAFHDGKSPGTTHMIKVAKAEGILVSIVKY